MTSVSRSSSISLSKWSKKSRRKTNGQCWGSQGTLSQASRGMWIKGKWPSYIKTTSLSEPPHPLFHSFCFKTSYLFLLPVTFSILLNSTPIAHMVLGQPDPKVSPQQLRALCQAFLRGTGLDSPGRSQDGRGEVWER